MPLPELSHSEKPPAAAAFPDPSGAKAALPAPTTGGFDLSDRRLPLQGMTVLVVEDSRYASDAMRLLCQRAGARLRRADSIAAAMAHLQVYRPDAVIVDLGLPDGPGEGLISHLVTGARRPALVLGTSGQITGREQALEAGADGFLAKPIESLAAFCRALLADLPLWEPQGRLGNDPPPPDPLALQDDLKLAARVLDRRPSAAERSYLGGFLVGLARIAQDAPLASLANRASLDHSHDPALRRLIAERLAGSGEAGFAATDSARP